MIKSRTDAAAKDSARISRAVTIFWCLFVGVGALGGGIAMFADPMGVHTGMNGFFLGFSKLPFYETLFRNLIFPGISLICVNCIPNTVTAVLLIKKRRNAPAAGMACGALLMLWICIQFVIFPVNGMSTAYFIFGLLQFIGAYVCLVRMRQDECALHTEDYPNIGKSSDTLVAYFSRTGRTRLLAYEKAQETGADICEIKTGERTEGTLGFWWCGRFGMHGREMPLTSPTDVGDKYKKVIICAPVWVFGVCAPVRTFCKMLRDKDLRTEYVITHFNGAAYASVADKMDGLTDRKRDKATSVTVRLGRIVKETKI